MSSRYAPESLVCEGIGVSFGGLHAVRDVSLRVEPGIVVGIIGPNGAGKSTLMNAISGFVTPSAGRVLFGDRDVTAWSSARRARSGLARTFQQAPVLERLTVLENVCVAGLGSASVSSLLRTRWGGRQASTLRDDAFAALQLVGLDGLHGRPASDLTFGECRLLSLARLIMLGGQWALIDEPFAGLTEDEVRRERVVIRRLAADGFGVCVIDHNVAAMGTICDRLIVMDHGTQIASGSPDEVFANRDVQAVYVGPAPEAASG